MLWTLGIGRKDPRISSVTSLGRVRFDGRLCGALAAAAVIWAGAGFASADAITVPNYSFELNASGNQITAKQKDFNNVLAWTSSNTTSGNDKAGVEANPSVGSYAAYLTAAGSPLDNIIPTANVTVQAGTYTLQVDVRHSGSTVPTSNDFAIALYANSTGTSGGTKTLIGSQSFLITSGTYATDSVTAVVPTGSSLIGQSLQIEITENSAAYDNVDNVQLSVTPEPASLGLLGLALGAMTLRRGERRKA